MKQRSQPSPFAAKSRQEQLEQWICWQQEQRLQRDAKTLAQELPPQAQQPLPEQPVRPRHSQYDAVMDKMRRARRQAGQDTIWPG